MERQGSPRYDVKRTHAVGAAGGVLFLSASKIYFMFAGYAVAFGLPRLFSSAHEYGEYGLVNRAVSVLNMVVIGGTIQTVSRFVAAYPDSARGTARTALAIQAVVGTALASGYFLLSPFIADALGDPSLAGLMQISSGIVLCYSLYGAMIGSLNGRKLFDRQAGLDAGYSTLKAVLVLTGAYAGFGVKGAVAGFVAASALILAPAYVVSRKVPGGKGVSWKELLSFQAPMYLYNLVLYMLLGLDLFAVRSLSDPGVAGTRAGLYTAAQYLGQLPYTLVVAATLVLFPMVSGVSSSGGGGAAGRYVETALKYALVALVPLSVLLSADAADVVTFFYPEGYAGAAAALEVLSFGGLFLALLAISCAAVSGYGKAWNATAFLSLGLAASAVTDWYLVPVLGMRGAAIGTAIGGASGFAAVFGYLRRELGVSLSPGLAARLCISGALLWFGAKALDWPGRLGLVLEWVVLGGGYLAILIVFKDLGKSDLDRILGRFSSRR